MIANLTQRFKKQMMNGKLLPLMATGISLVLAAGTLSPSFAQSTTPGNSTPQKHQRGEWGKKLNLTEQQKADLKAIRESVKTQMNGVLNQTQRDQLAAAKGDRKQMRQVWKSLNLSDEQKASIKKIRAEAKQKMDAILTPEQRQQIQQARQNHKRNGGKAQMPN